MSIDYSLDIATDWEPQQIQRLIVETLGFNVETTPAHTDEDGYEWPESSYLWTEGVSFSVREEDEKGQDYIERIFGFRSQVYIYFTPFAVSDAEDGYDAGRLNMLRVVLLVLQHLNGNAVWLYNSAVPILQRMEGELAISEEFWWAEWFDLKGKWETLQVHLPHQLLPLDRFRYSLVLATDTSAEQVLEVLANSPLRLERHPPLLKGEGLMVWSAPAQALNQSLYEQKMGNFGQRPQFYSPEVIAQHLGVSPTVHVGFEIFTLSPQTYEADNRDGYVPGLHTVLQAAAFLLRQLSGDAVFLREDVVVLRRLHTQIVIKPGSLDIQPICWGADEPEYWQDEEALADFFENEFSLPYEVEALPQLPFFDELQTSAEETDEDESLLTT